MLDLIHTLFSQLVTAGWLPEMFSYGFLINAFLATLMIGPLLGALGTLVVVKRLAFLSEAVGHSALTGVSIGILLGEPISAPWISLFAFSILFAMTLQWVKGRTAVPYDALIGVFLSFALAVGAALLMFVAKQVNAHLVEQVLFGSILTANEQDIVILAVMFMLTLGLALRFSNKAFLAALSPEITQSLRVKTKLHDYVFVLLIALMTVAAVKIIGAVLVGALLLIPAASARLLATNLQTMLLWSILIATSSALAGVLLPMYLQWAVPTGPAIILCACLWFIVAITRFSLSKAAVR
ncbi:metal ABC transporter permease [Planctobacterium marinum]|uniref:metal ABC transporter permease n=1 Tax=Planctobacterium marinum TaxID=1631968 RepID=UPI001E48BB4F|nr:iron chelate uptake ABC transporter family permease subunit [Planctobacterium marinum]MCC2603967.1 metal ABC transporter permease [Planctobacterium marinum]